MSTPNLINQGVLVADKQYYSPNSHINSSNLFNSAMRNGVEMDNIGLIKTWAQMFKNVQPLYNFESIAKETMYVESEKGFTYSTAIALENPKVVEDLTDTDTPGVDGQTFKLAFDKPFSITQTITYDHINSKIALIVVAEPYSDGDRYIHELKIHGQASKNSYISKEFLTPGTQFYQISAYRGDEYDTVAATFQSQVGERLWHYYLGNSEVAYDFEISKKALLMAKSGKYQGDSLRVYELGKFSKDSEAYKYMLGDPSTNLTKVLNAVYKGDGKAMSQDMIAKSWFFEIEKTTMDKLMYDYVMNLMWGVGGRTQLQTDIISVTPGLYWQHRNYGSVVRYNYSQFSLDFLKAKIEQHLRNRLDFNQETTIIIKVGAGAYNVIKKLIKAENAGSGVVINSDDPRKFLGGTNRFDMNYALEYTGFFLNQFPRTLVKMELEQALDPVYANDISNPIVDGIHRLSSFTIILYDLNDIEASNIKLCKWKYDDKMRYQKQIGNIDWNDQNSTFISSGNLSGIKGTMSLRHGGMWLVDPTKSLMFEMINPK